jgi:DNA repair exonuclease SbcCD nuclease subunit
MKLLFFTDPHNADHPPKMRVDGYCEQILEKQEQILKIAQEEKVDYVICGGDTFHVKNTTQISHKLVNKLLEIYRELPDTFILPGNHDFVSNIEEVNDNPLGLFRHLSNVDVVMSPLHWSFDEAVMMFFPFKLFVDMKEWRASLADVRRSYKELKPKMNRPVLLFAHAPISTIPFPYEVIYYDDIEPLADCLYCGHLHTLQETGPTFCNPGSLSRGDLNLDETFDRQVGCIIGTIDKGELTNAFVPLLVKQADEVFKVEKAMTKLASVQAVADFLEHITDMKIPKSLDKDELIVEIRKLDIDEGTKTKALSILETL